MHRCMLSEGRCFMPQKAKYGSVVVLLALCVTGESALAFYSPRCGRWLSRDPIDDHQHTTLMGLGFRPQEHDVPSEYDEIDETESSSLLISAVGYVVDSTNVSVADATLEPNLYAYVKSSPTSNTDLFGLRCCHTPSGKAGCGTAPFPNKGLAPPCNAASVGTSVCNALIQCPCDGPPGLSCTEPCLPVGVQACQRCIFCRDLYPSWIPPWSRWPYRYRWIDTVWTRSTCQ